MSDSSSIEEEEEEGESLEDRMKFWGPDLQRTKISMQRVNDLKRDGKSLLKEVIKMYF